MRSNERLTSESSTGAATLVGPSEVFIKGLAFDPGDGELWGTDASGGVYKLDVYSGLATLVGNTGLPATPDIHFDPEGVLYGSSGGGLSPNNLITIDKFDGEATVLGALTASGTGAALVLHFDTLQRREH